MLYMLFSSLAKDQYVINEDKHIVSQCCKRIDLTVCQEFRMIKDLVHHSLESCWGIGEAKGKNSELVVAIGSPEGSLGSVRFLQQDLMEARRSIQTCEVLRTLQLVKQIINTRQGIAIFYCKLVKCAVINDHAQGAPLFENKQYRCSIRTDRRLNKLLLQKFSNLTFYFNKFSW